MTTATAVAAPTLAVRGRDVLRRRRRREVTDRYVVSLLVLAAALLAAWPVLGTYNNNYQAFLFARSADHQASTMSPATADAALQRAHDYNAALPVSLLTDPIGQSAVSSPEYQHYESLLRQGETMGTLRLPTIGSTLPILHGTSDETLARGAGHMYGTHLPVGGEGTHAGIAAHRGLPTMTAFDDLPDMQVGHQFFVDVLGETLAYQVTEVHTVLPDDLSKVTPVAGQDLVTLVTCTPYGINSHRFLVTGERIPLADADPALVAPAGFDWTPQDWMLPRLWMAGLALTVLLGLVLRWAWLDTRALNTRPATVPASA